MKLAIYMSSRYKNYDKLNEILKNTIGSLGQPIDEIMYNEKNDLIKKWADENRIKTHAFSEEWDVYDKNAGPICVSQMIKPADKCIALWDGGSKGCRTFIEKCYESGKPPITKKLNTSIDYPNRKEQKQMDDIAAANQADKYMSNIPPSVTQHAPTAATTKASTDGATDDQNTEQDIQQGTTAVQIPTASSGQGQQDAQQGTDIQQGATMQNANEPQQPQLNMSSAPVPPNTQGIDNTSDTNTSVNNTATTSTPTVTSTAVNNTNVNTNPKTNNTTQP